MARKKLNTEVVTEENTVTADMIASIEPAAIDDTETEIAAALNEATETDLAPAAQNQASFMDLVSEVTDEQRETFKARLNEGLDTRVAFERAKSSFNENIQRTIKNARNQLTTPGIVAALLSCSVSPDFMNRELRAGDRFNVYAMPKMHDLAMVLRHGGAFTNKINNAVVTSFVRCWKAGVTFTNDTARWAASDKYRDVKPEVLPYLVRHTVSTSTAPTQVSSTFNALETMGLVKNTGTAKNPIWALADTPQAQRLLEVVA